MAFGSFGGWQQPGYPAYAPGQPMPDQLAQLRTQQYPQQGYAQQPYAQQPQQSQQGGGFIWVQGEAGAKSYMVAPGNHVLLMDSEQCAFYIKSADAAGMPSMRAFDYVERAPQRQQAHPAQSAEYVTRAEFNALAARLEALMPAKQAEKVQVTVDEQSAV
jgi:hypothetical protein